MPPENYEFPPDVCDVCGSDDVAFVWSRPAAGLRLALCEEHAPRPTEQETAMRVRTEMLATLAAGCPDAPPEDLV